MHGDLLNHVAVAVAGGKTHFAVYTLGILAERALDNAHGLDELTPVGGIQEPETGDAVADGDLIGGLPLVLGPHQFFNRCPGL